MDPHISIRNVLLTVSPFYHYNSADYQGGPNDFPVISTVASERKLWGPTGGLSTSTSGKMMFRVGVYGFGQHQYNFFDNPVHRW